MANVVSQPISPSPLSISLKDFTRIPNSLDPETNTYKIPRLNYITHAGDGTGRLYTNDQRGKMYIISPEGKLLGTFLDLSKRVGPKFEVDHATKGFTYFTFHPEYASNGLFYTIHSEATSGNATFPFSGEIFNYGFNPDLKPTHDDVLLEWRDNNPADNIFQGRNREVLRIEQPYIGHNTGQIGFNPTAIPHSPDYGNLYIALGDGGQGISRSGVYTAQDLSTPLGKVLRINPQGNNGRNSQYGIPEDNPFAKHPRHLPEIWAYGFRNPHRFSWDLTNGNLLLTDIGHESVEEVNLILPRRNYGWQEREGNYQTNPRGSFFESVVKKYPSKKPDRFTYPVAWYDHDAPGAAIAGGYVYQGSAIPYLQNQYVFADFSGDSRWFITPASSLVLGRQASVSELRILRGGRQISFLDILDNTRSDVRFGLGEDQEIYVTNKRDGIIRKLVPSQEYLSRKPRLIVPDFSIIEGNRLGYPVTLVGQVSEPVVFKYTMIEGSADANGDFPRRQGRVSFTPHQQEYQTKYINLGTKSDSLVEADETFFLQWQSNEDVISPKKSKVNILNDDHRLSFRNSFTIEEGETLEIPYKLLGSLNEGIRVTYNWRSGSAKEFEDVRIIGSQTIFYPSRKRTNSGTITIKSIQDRDVELEEFFWLEVQASTSTRTVTKRERIKVTILDDERPDISIEDLQVTESDRNQRVLLNLSLSHPSRKRVTLNYKTIQGTARANRDYLSRNGTITFAPDTTKATLPLVIKGDKIPEVEENFQVRLFSPENALIDKRVAEITIVDDDYALGNSLVTSQPRENPDMLMGKHLHIPFPDFS